MPIGFNGDMVTVCSISHARHFQRGRQQVVRERGIAQLTVFVECQLLVEGVADALRHAAVDLPRQNRSD